MNRRAFSGVDYMKLARKSYTPKRFDKEETSRIPGIGIRQDPKIMDLCELVTIVALWSYGPPTLWPCGLVALWAVAMWPWPCFFGHVRHL